MYKVQRFCVKLLKLVFSKSMQEPYMDVRSGKEEREGKGAAKQRQEEGGEEVDGEGGHGVDGQAGLPCHRVGRQVGVGQVRCPLD